ncbi:MAG: outer membrane protein [Rhodoferax sp.]
MKKLIITAAVSATFIMSPQAFAQASKFEGFSIGVALGSYSPTFEVQTSLSTRKADQSATGLGMTLNYDKAINSNMLLGFGMDIGLTNRKYGTLTGTSNEVEAKSNVGIYGTLGYAATDSFVAYGKIAMQSTNLQGSTGGNTTHTGPAFGVGAKYLFDKNWVGSLEYMNNTYEDVKQTGETDKLKSSSISIGIAYKF